MGVPDLLRDLVYLLLQVVLFGGSRGEGNVPLVILENVWCFVGSERVSCHAVSHVSYHLVLADSRRFDDGVLCKSGPSAPENVESPLVGCLLHSFLVLLELVGNGASPTRARQTL